MLRYNQKHRLLSAGAELRGIKPYRLRLIKMAIETGRLIFFDGIEATAISQILAAIRDKAGRGDIEQDGHILIGIGRSADKTQTYYSAIKARRARHAF
jgi:hypothetical protein